jgi:hypothetical protein
MLVDERPESETLLGPGIVLLDMLAADASASTGGPRLKRDSITLAISTDPGRLVSAISALVTVRNALTQEGSLLILLEVASLERDLPVLRELALGAGFWRLRELALSERFSILECKR